MTNICQSHHHKKRSDKMYGAFFMAVLIYFLIFCPSCLAQEAKKEAKVDGTDEIKKLYIENQSLTHTIEILRSKIAALKAENIRLRAILVQEGFDPEEKLIETSVDASPETNTLVAKAFCAYYEVFQKIKRSSNLTSPQKAAMLSKARKNLQLVLSRNRVTITYKVWDIQIREHETAWLFVGNGVIKSSDPHIPNVTLRTSFHSIFSCDHPSSYYTISIRMSKKKVLHIKKGSILTITGILGLAKSDVIRRRKLSTLSRLDHSYYKITIQKEFRIALNGRYINRVALGKVIHVR